ncbi:uncharacterized protein LOC114741399 [Neltuma alba]|uniref:uncharacterized protein LOC114741399 n=1 Tax=Neltuma alba TaxID=207710 RepID=UPI0010A33781|nr:uncharacterized protein LOC114741399 [Prosopis alba]
MELGLTSSTATADSAGSAKVRLMCSYGGHIVPRPGPNKPFCYVGGDTRIVSFDRRTITTLDLLVSHLSATLCVSFSFTLKYQLPHLDLNSLISLTSDEDFQILIDEYDRLCSSPPSSAPSRIRVFLFPTYMLQGSSRPVIRHPKTESWFFDALKSAKILQKGLGETHGFGFCYGSGVEAHGFVSSGPESMVLETSSSFGSTSSTASLTNLPFKSQSNEENEFVLQDNKAKLMQTNTVPNDNSVSNIVPHYHHQGISYQDPIIVQASSSMEARAGYGTETTIISETTANSTNSPNLNQQVQRQQHVQFVPLQHMTYQPIHPYPIYLVPSYAQIPPNSSLPTTASGHSSLMVSQNYYTAPVASSAATPSHVSPMHVQSHNVAVTNTESADQHGGGGDLDHVLIYKSQPPPPSLPNS